MRFIILSAIMAAILFSGCIQEDPNEVDGADELPLVSKPAAVSEDKIPPNCEKIPSQQDRDRCIFDEAVRLGSVKVCDFIKEPLWNQQCMRQVAKHTRQKDICEIITDEFEKQSCFMDLAIELKDASLCGNVGEQSRVDSCYYRVGFDTRSEMICELIDSESSRYRCMALVTQNISFCDMLEDVRPRDFCYRRVSDISSDPDICRLITTDDWADECMINAASKALDITLCDEVGLNLKKQECRDGVEKAKEIAKNMNQGLIESGAKIIPKI